MEREMKGDGADDPKVQFDPCKYKDNECKYIDNYGNCIFENCIFDQEETPPLVKLWWFKCIFCGKPQSIDPRHKKIHVCNVCLNRIHSAEVLPFTCRYCGKSQRKESTWIFSNVCDDCVAKMNPNIGI